MGLISNDIFQISAECPPADNWFSPCDAMHSTDYPVALSICPSVTAAVLSFFPSKRLLYPQTFYTIG